METNSVNSATIALSTIATLFATAAFLFAVTTMVRGMKEGKLAKNISSATLVWCTLACLANLMWYVKTVAAGSRARGGLRGLCGVYGRVVVVWCGGVVWEIVWWCGRGIPQQPRKSPRGGCW